jgi:hypothetical protein
MNMIVEDIEGELVASGWVARPGDDDAISEEEFLAGIEGIAWAMDANLEKREHWCSRWLQPYSTNVKHDRQPERARGSLHCL